ncbi:MAG: PGF-pre-PGF domain-containing protein [Natronomonas sp.]|jgi:PGF-pre-PGF domain-containing protein|uniref:PKD domain-containing protein n=1 Tax=Natronomonas sp. TaxID=2184060 RepID=UPI0039897ABF
MSGDAPLRSITACSLVVLVALAVVGASGTAAAGSSTPVSVYADSSDTLTVLYANGTTASLGVTAEVAGPLTDLDGDGELEAPYVNSNSDLVVAEISGNTRTLVTAEAKKTNAYVATGDWDEDGTPAVFYENTSNGNLYRVESGESPSPILDPSGKKTATNSPLGIADYDGDGADDLVFLGSSSTIKYYDGKTVASTGFSSFGTNNGLGIGEPADFDGDGTPRVPYVTGSNDLALLAADGSKTTLDGNYQKAVKAPVAGGDWAGGSELEMLHVNKDDNQLYYSFLNGTVNPVNGTTGSTIGTTPSVGVVPSAAPPAPDITDYTVTNLDGREVRVAFNASDQLTAIEINVTGAENVMLTESNTTESGSGPYRYVANYTGSVDGEYTATLERAANTDAIDGAGGETGTVTIETPAPVVENVTLTDVTDGDGLVTGGDTTRINATVANESNLTAITANASAFGAGTVDLSATTGSSYEGTVTVNASNVDDDGDTDVSVLAENEFNHTDSNRSGTLFLDTTPPDADAGPNATIEEDTKVIFDGDGSTDNSRIVGYEWDFGDGASATDETPEHVYNEPGNYTVTLTAEDAVNQTATDTLTLNVTEAANDSSSGGSTDVVYVTESDDDETPTTTETTNETTNETNTTILRASTLERRIVNQAVNDSVALTFNETNETERVVPKRLSFTTLRGGNFSVLVDSFEEPPAEVPAVSANRTVAVPGYFDVNHTIANENLSEVEMSVAVPKSEIPDRAEGDELVVYRYHEGSWDAHETIRMDKTAETVRFHTRLPGLSYFAVGFRQPAITVEQAWIESGSDNDSVGVTALVENRGETSGTTTLALEVDGERVTTKAVTLPAGEKRTVTFYHVLDEPGEHQLSVNETAAGVVTVEPSATPTETSTATPTVQSEQSKLGNIAWLLLFAGGLAAGIGGAEMFRKR